MTKQKHGGRPPTGRPTGRKVTLYMLPDVEQRAREIGGGNLSAGAAIAIRGWKLDRLRDICTRLIEADRKGIIMGGGEGTWNIMQELNREIGPHFISEAGEISEEQWKRLSLTVGDSRNG